MTTPDKTTVPEPEVPQGPHVLSIGSVVDIEGLRLKLVYVNSGQGRLTFSVLDGARVFESDRDPVVGVT